jgi:hypothetical protein
MRAVSAVLLLLGALRPARAEVSDGHSDCPCIGLPSKVPVFDCDEDFAFNGKCVIPPAIEWRATHDGQDPVPYPGDYGSMCKKHLEPGDSSCWDFATGQELSAAERASWCDNSWCYVDPTNCALTGAAESGYGWMTTDCDPDVYPHEPCPVVYSYETCGSFNLFAPQYIGKTRDFSMLLMTQFMNALPPPSIRARRMVFSAGHKHTPYTGARRERGRSGDSSRGRDDTADDTVDTAADGRQAEQRAEHRGREEEGNGTARAR